jgi:CheY-like chemotaxis protein
MRENNSGNVLALPMPASGRKGGSVSQMPTDVQTVTRPVRRLNGRIPLVLIADGNAVSRELREAQLRAAGVRVSVARTGFEAIVKASCQVPDVILLDDSLSDIEPAETGRLLTTCPMTAHIPVVRLVRGRRLPRRILTRLSR